MSVPPGNLNETISGVVLDTSGAVQQAAEYRNGRAGTIRVHFDDLSPLEQGYVEALFASQTNPAGEPFRIRSDKHAAYVRCGFSDLHPETLAAIRKDCAAYMAAVNRAFAGGTVHHTAKGGGTFWRQRQKGSVLKRDFPPLTPFLDDEGKVRLRGNADTSDGQTGPGRDQ